jgi:hypothetical protein
MFVCVRVCDQTSEREEGEGRPRVMCIFACDFQKGGRKNWAPRKRGEERERKEKKTGYVYTF